MPRARRRERRAALQAIQQMQICNKKYFGRARARVCAFGGSPCPLAFSSESHEPSVHINTHRLTPLPPPHTQCTASLIFHIKRTAVAEQLYSSKDHLLRSVTEHRKATHCASQLKGNQLWCFSKNGVRVRVTVKRSGHTMGVPMLSTARLSCQGSEDQTVGQALA
eukprot:353221-Chlamydomonas_euryale.AAC.4